MVLVGRDPDGGNGDPCIDNDHLAGTRTVLDHLEARGARRPALLAIDLDDAFTDDCITGYREWCAQRSIEPKTVMMPAGTTARDAEPLIGKTLFGPDAPDALHTRFGRWAPGSPRPPRASGSGSLRTS